MAAVHMTPAARTDSEAQLAAILKSLDDDKAEDVVQIDLRGRSAMGDYMVICSGRSSRTSHHAFATVRYIRYP